MKHWAAQASCPLLPGRYRLSSSLVRCIAPLGEGGASTDVRSSDWPIVLEGSVFILRTWVRSGFSLWGFDGGEDCSHRGRDDGFRVDVRVAS